MYSDFGDVHVWLMSSNYLPVEGAVPCIRNALRFCAKP